MFDILLLLQSDRPSSQYWNSGMVAAHRALAAELNLVISHMTEQASHNKVMYGLPGLTKLHRTLLMASSVE